MFTLKLLRPKEPTDRPTARPTSSCLRSSSVKNAGEEGREGAEGRGALGESKRETPLNQSSFRNREEEAERRKGESEVERGRREKEREGGS